MRTIEKLIVLLSSIIVILSIVIFSHYYVSIDSLKVLGYILFVVIGVGSFIIIVGYIYKFYEKKWDAIPIDNPFVIMALSIIVPITITVIVKGTVKFYEVFILGQG